jgi:two-component sensor histidine kinase/putative methionine-R-sulfoxide reductase with GAF domain
MLNIPKSFGEGAADLDVSAVFDDPVVLTERWLSSRRPRLPDHARENAALLALADELAQRPDNVLNLLCELILEICDADSAGVSLLDGEKDEFVWTAVAGTWAPLVNGGMPRSASPCGKVVEHDQVLIFRDVLAQFPAAAEAGQEIEEIMLAPFHREGVPIGTVWAISHDRAREFDAEDRRVLSNLARFAAAAYQTASAQQAARTAQDQLSIANRELGHRLKNLLTMVMAITAQTLKGHEDQTDVRALQRRLEALGAAHKVLIEQESPTASMMAIARTVLGTIGQLDRVTLDGPDVTFGPRTALACSLILHELGTNALKYGALSKPDGRVSLSWALEGDEAEPVLRFRWSETGGPPVARPKRSGFGTRLIGMGLLGSGGTRTDYAPGGLTVEMSAPMREAATF